MFSNLTNGGPFIFVILTVSLIALTIFCERCAFLYFRLTLNMEKAFKKIMIKLEKSNYRGALEECSKIEKHPMGRILKAGLLKSDKKDKEIDRAMEEKILQEIPKVKVRVNWLTLFANIATLLGLLGTILGLIVAFDGVSKASEAMKQQILADGISMAMMTTALGLIVAIPCLVGFYLLNNRGDFIIDQMEEKAFRLSNALSSLKRNGSV